MRGFPEPPCQDTNRWVNIIQWDVLIYPAKIYDKWKEIQLSTKIRNTNQMVLSNIIRVGHSNDSMCKDHLNSSPDTAVDLE